MATVAAAAGYTPTQLDAFAARVGRTFWTVTAENRSASFLSAPTSKASVFHLEPNESFEITELVNRQSEHPLYEVRLESGKVAYIEAESFQQELNLTILTVDPLADQKKRAAAASEEDKKRVEWIRAQPWSPAVKEAAIQRRPVPGLNTAETKKVMGNPNRVTKVHAPQRYQEEHWYYPDGMVLIFQNKQLNRVETKAGPEKQKP